jgi:hypothetical protein
VRKPIDWTKIDAEWAKRLAREAAKDWVYFVRIDQVVKIGHSKRLLPRIRSFAAYGQEVEVLAFEAGGRDLEGRLHRRFEDDRVKVGLSRELFAPSADILEYIESGRRCADCDKKAQPRRLTCFKHASDEYESVEALIGVQLHAEKPEFPMVVG